MLMAVSDITRPFADIGTTSKTEVYIAGIINPHRCTYSILQSESAVRPRELARWKVEEALSPGQVGVEFIRGYGG